MLDIDEEIVKEFKEEALDLLQKGETNLLALEHGASKPDYDSLLRVFHNIKGGAGMAGMALLQSQMHALETLLAKYKEKHAIPRQEISVFLEGIDKAKKLLSGKVIPFEPKREMVEAVSKTSVASSIQAGESKKVIEMETKRALERGVCLISRDSERISLVKRVLAPLRLSLVVYDSMEGFVGKTRRGTTSLMIVDHASRAVPPEELLAEIRTCDKSILFITLCHQTQPADPSLQLKIFSQIPADDIERLLLPSCHYAIKYGALLALHQKMIHFIMSQFADLDDFLKISGNEDLRRQITTDLQSLFESRRQILRWGS